MHVRTVRSLASTRFLGLGLCLLTLSLTGCPNDDAPPLVAEETPPQTARFAYVANGGSANVSAYTIHATTGALTAVAGSPFAIGIGANQIYIDPTGKAVYLTADESAGLDALTINASTGVLTAVAGSPFATGGTTVMDMSLASY